MDGDEGLLTYTYRETEKKNQDGQHGEACYIMEMPE